MSRPASLAAALPVVSAARARDVLRSAFWLVPSLCVLASIGLAVGLIALDQHLPAAHGFFLYPGPPDGARSFLSSIITAMISFTGLVFSITIVVLQLTSGQFSPRVLRMFLRDRTIQATLGVFMATFVYAMTVQRAVLGTQGHDPFVPRIAVTVAFVFVLASVGLFIRYIDHVANLVRAATIVSAIGAQARHVLERRYPPDAAAPEEPAAPRPAPSRTIPARSAGVLVSVNEELLVRIAADAGCVLALVPRVGDFVPAGAPLCLVRPQSPLAADDGADDGADRWPDHGPELDERVHGEVALDTERTMEQDLAFGFRQLVDIAERALSPAVNDPTTACQSLDVLHDLLRRLATRHLPGGSFRDPGGRVRLVVPQYAFADFLAVAVAVGEVWRYGSDAAQVPERIAGMLVDLAAAALPEHRRAVEHWLGRPDIAEVMTAAARPPS